MCTHEDTLARYLGAPSLDDVMSRNELTTHPNHLKTVLFVKRTALELLNIKLVWFSDPHHICLLTQRRSTDSHFNFFYNFRLLEVVMDLEQFRMLDKKQLI